MKLKTLAYSAVATSIIAIGLRGDAKEYKGHKYKGTIELVGKGKITLRDEDEETTDFIVVPQTSILRDEKPARLEDLQADDVAVITVQSEGSQLVALRVFVMEPQ